MTIITKTWIDGKKVIRVESRKVSSPEPHRS